MGSQFEGGAHKAGCSLWREQLLTLHAHSGRHIERMWGWGAGEGGSITFFFNTVHALDLPAGSSHFIQSPWKRPHRLPEVHFLGDCRVRLTTKIKHPMALISLPSSLCNVLVTTAKDPSLLIAQLDRDDRDSRETGLRSSEGSKMPMRRVIDTSLRDRWLNGKCELLLSACQLFSCGRHVWPPDGTEHVGECSASEA